MIARAATAVLAVLLVLAAALTVAYAVLGVPGRTDRDDDLEPADVARDTPTTQAAPLDPATDLAGWAADTAGRTGVPARALLAYGTAEIAQRAASPACGVSWATLAGIGRVESDHGRLGADLDPAVDGDGVSRPRIVGVPLDGSEGVRDIPDSDAGVLDGDPVHDRAVGPMQFLPTTWARFGADGNGDGTPDPHQLDDAARGAAAYLCSDDRDLVGGPGWWDAVLAYNRSVDYARRVWAATDRYASAVNMSNDTSR